MQMKMLAMAAAIVGGVGLATAANAAPIAAPSASTLAGDAQVSNVAYGCGPGFAPGRFGYCRPIFRRYGYYGPRRFYGPRPVYGPPRFYGPRRFYY